MSGGSSVSSNASTFNGPSRVLVRLIVGHTSEKLAHLTPNGHTHRWTIYVKAPGAVQFSDRSFIRKVVFLLHDSFNNPTRVIKEPPFQVTETGYGGFMMPIKIHFAGIDKTFTINYDLSLSLVDRFCESNIEHKLELKDPTPEMVSLVQKYCPKKKEKEVLKDSIKEKPAFSKSQFALKPIDKQKNMITSNAKTISNGTTKEGIEKKSSDKEKKRSLEKIRKLDTHETLPSTSKASQKSTPGEEKSVKSKFIDSNSYSSSNNIESSKLFETTANAKSSTKLIPKNANSKINNEAKVKETTKLKKINLKTEEFVDSMFEPDTNNLKKESAIEFDDFATKKKKKKEKEKLRGNLENEKLKDQMKRPSSGKSEESSRPSSSAGENLDELRKKLKKPIPADADDSSKIKKFIDAEKMREKKSSQLKTAMKDSDCVEKNFGKLEKKKLKEKIKQGDSLKQHKRKHDISDDSGNGNSSDMSGALSKKSKAVGDVKTEPNSPYENNECEKRPHSSISLHQHYSSTNMSSGANQSPYSIQSASALSITPITTPQVTISSTRSDEINDDVYDDSKDEGFTVEDSKPMLNRFDTERNVNECENIQNSMHDSKPSTSDIDYDSEDDEMFGNPTEKLRRYNALQKSINSIANAEDELQYRILDTIMSMERDVIQYDELLTHARFKLRYLKKETFFALENVIYNFVPTNDWLEEARLKWKNKSKEEAE